MKTVKVLVGIIKGSLKAKVIAGVLAVTVIGGATYGVTQYISANKESVNSDNKSAIGNVVNDENNKSSEVVENTTESSVEEEKASETALGENANTETNPEGSATESSKGTSTTGGSTSNSNTNTGTNKPNNNQTPTVPTKPTEPTPTKPTEPTPTEPTKPTEPTPKPTPTYEAFAGYQWSPSQPRNHHKGSVGGSFSSFNGLISGNSTVDINTAVYKAVEGLSMGFDSSYIKEKYYNKLFNGKYVCTDFQVVYYSTPALQEDGSSKDYKQVYNSFKEKGLESLPSGLYSVGAGYYAPYDNDKVYGGVRLIIKFKEI